MRARHASFRIARRRTQTFPASLACPVERLTPFGRNAMTRYCSHRVHRPHAQSCGVADVVRRVAHRRLLRASDAVVRGVAEADAVLAPDGAGLLAHLPRSP